VSDRPGLKSWLGYRPENQDGPSAAPDLMGRIHELESEIATLRAKPELADLSEAEVAVTILKAAHTREALAAATGERILAQANSDAAALTIATQKQSFETINAAEKNAASIVAKGMQDAETLVRNATNEANALRTAAQEEVRQYKSWLVTNVKETLKLQASQDQALAAATKNIEVWQANVNGAVALLSAHQQSLETELAKGDSLGQ
jgi:vacuolar-type H+-ATPase subunit H